MVIRMTSTRPRFGAGWALLLLALFAGCAAAPKGESSPDTAPPEKARVEEHAAAGESPQAEEEEHAAAGESPQAEEPPQPESTRRMNRALRRNPALRSAKGKTPRIVQRGPRSRKRPPAVRPEGPPAMPEAPEPEPPEGPESSKSSRPAPPTVPAPAGQTKAPSARAGAPEQAPPPQKRAPSGKSGRRSPSQKPGAGAPPRSDSPPSSGANPLLDQASSSETVSPEAPPQGAPEGAPAPQKPGAQAPSASQAPREPQSSPKPKAPPRPSAGSRNPPEPKSSPRPQAPAPQKSGAGAPSAPQASPKPREPQSSPKPQADSLPFPVPDDMVAGRQIDGPGEIVILLEGSGWVFRSDLSTPGNWRFLSRKREGQSTRFDYYFPDKGHWNLVFTRQNLSSGEDDAAVRKVQVGPAPVDAGPPVPPSGAETAVSGEALTSAEKRYRAAQEASEAGNPRDAIALWEEDASSSGPAGRRARLAVVKEALAVSGPATLVKWLEPCIRDGAGPEVLAAALELLESQAGYPEATMTVLEALSRWDGHPDSPQWLYRLARKLEEPGENRNLDRALAIYRQIVNNWPFTRWRDLSEERILWLQQHYYRVR